jgi:hypothetical protein
MSAAFEGLLRTKFGNRWKKVRGRRGMEYRVCCPFCLRNKGTPDKGFKLYMNPSQNVYNCYRCTEGGQLQRIFSEFRQMESTPFAAPVVKPVTVDMPGQVVPLHTLPYDHVARQYLHRRGFNTEILSQALGVHYCVEGRVYGGASFYYNTTNTLIFPVWMHGKVVGWQSRLLYEPDKLTDEECAAYGFPQNDEQEYVRPPKYYTPWGMSKGDVLYNFDNARKSRVVVVSEGPLDVAGIGMCGAATFGKGVSENQARLIKEYWDMAILMLDPGDADAEMQQLLYELRMSIRVIPVKLQGVKDPGDASFARIWTQIYDTVAQQGLDLCQYNLGPWNQAVIRLTDRV